MLGVTKIPMTTYRFNLATSAIGDAMSSIQILRAGRIKRIEWALGYLPAIADAGSVAVQLSSQVIASPIEGQVPTVLAEVNVVANRINTATQATSFVQQSAGGIDVDIPVSFGQQLSLNSFDFGVMTGTFNGGVLLYVQD